MNVLPPERQRKVVGRNSTSNDLVARFNLCRQKVLDSKVAPEPKAIEPEDPEVIVLEKEVMVELPREQVLESITNEEFIREAAKRLAPVLSSLGSISQLVQVISRDRTMAAAQEVVSRPRFDLGAPTVRKPRVLVFGFLHGQDQEIKTKAAGFNLDLIFYKKEGRQVEPPPSCQWCIMIKKVGHPAWNKIRDNMGTDRVFLVEGVTDAMKKLADINALIGTGVR